MIEPAASDRKISHVVAGHDAGVAGLDRCIERIRADIARRERVLARPPVSVIVERYQAPRRAVPAWLERMLDVTTAISLGIIVGYLLGRGI
jgi:hypothetical protein